MRLQSPTQWLGDLRQISFLLHATTFVFTMMGLAVHGWRRSNADHDIWQHFVSADVIDPGALMDDSASTPGRMPCRFDLSKEESLEEVLILLPDMI